MYGSTFLQLIAITRMAGAITHYSKVRKSVSCHVFFLALNTTLMLKVDKVFLWSFSGAWIYGAQNIIAVLFDNNSVIDRLQSRWVSIWLLLRVPFAVCRRRTHLHRSRTEMFLVGQPIMADPLPLPPLLLPLREWGPSPFLECPSVSTSLSSRESRTPDFW